MAGSSPSRWSRRRFLGVAGAGAASLALSACQDDGNADRGPGGPSATSTTAPPEPTLETLEAIDHGEPQGPPPFGLGVASGDPDHESVVLWTWVDRDPSAPVPLLVEVARDDGFGSIVARHELQADPGAAMTARTVVGGLAPDTRHWYRFVLDGHVTAPARTCTAPAPGELPAEPLRVGHLSCQRWSSGYWTALDDVAAQAPDVVVHCGDYVYESDGGSVRPVEGSPPTDLEGYRALWRRYKAEPELQAAHAVAPWLITWDDHEVVNNYHGTATVDGPGGDAFLERRAAAYRAWWEFTPTRLDPPEGAGLAIHRVVDWGALTRFVLLDTRQFRDEQPCDDTAGTDLGPRCDETQVTTMLGDEQEAWFDEVATGHDATWTTVVQQVVVHQWRLVPGNVVWNLDQWDGYTGARRRFLETLSRSPGPVVLSGDVHSSWVADLRADFDDDESPVVGAELVAPGISSDIPDRLRQVSSLVETLSPHIAWSETTRRGWVLHELDADGWRAAYRLVDDVSVPGAPVREETTWSIRPGAPGLA
jgi:alkaline phosphatase D